MDHIVVIVDGRVSEMGSYQELMKQNGAFAEFLRNYAFDDNVEEEELTSNCHFSLLFLFFNRFLYVLFYL